MQAKVIHAGLKHLERGDRYFTHEVLVEYSFKCTRRILWLNCSAHGSHKVQPGMIKDRYVNKEVKVSTPPGRRRAGREGGGAVRWSLITDRQSY